jgi:beta-glucosidase
MAEELKFPKGFLWGAATAAHQVEGDNYNNWSVWEKENAERLARQAKTLWQPWQQKQFPEMFDPQNYISGRAANHYHLFEKDFDIAQSLGHNAHRFSLEWSRIEPERGKFDEKEIKHYRSVLKALRERNIRPFVTLWHWTSPVWVVEQGGWENEKTVKDFERYVTKIAQSFSAEEIPVWMPVNEPGTFIGMGYVQGMFPPNVKNVFRANKSFKHLMDAHRRAYSIIHEHHAKAEVGLSHYATCVQPYRNGPVNRLAVWGLDYIRNWRFLDSVKDDVDFIGIQYYHRDVIDVVPRGGKWGFFDVKNPNDWVNDLNWDMYPEGIYQILKRTARYKKPIYITESGLADRDDRKRWEFIRRNLYWIHRAMSEGVDIRGYFHWSLLDNFEWDKGFWPRFGLVAVDFKTDERHIRPSARHYKQVCETNTLIP